MIISKTPFRVSFVGGGTDLPAFYEEETGAVVSIAINQYMYIAIHKYFEDKIHLKYSKTELVDKVDDIEHPIFKECLKLLNIKAPIEITSIADIPSGTGLGSSSSFTVGLLNALWATLEKDAHPELLAKKACEIELEKINSPIGKQDQYAAAFGGLNFMEFSKDGVKVEKIKLTKQKKDELENNLLMVYTGVQRNANTILQEQSDNTKNKMDSLRQMKSFAYELRDELKKGNIDALGELLHKNWEIKKTLTSNITTPEIDKLYEKGLQAGATGGKLIGAGGGGFLIFYCPNGKDKVKQALKNLKEFKIKLDPMGSRIIYREE